MVSVRNPPAGAAAEVGQLGVGELGGKGFHRDLAVEDVLQLPVRLRHQFDLFIGHYRGISGVGGVGGHRLVGVTGAAVDGVGHLFQPQDRDMFPYTGVRALGPAGQFLQRLLERQGNVHLADPPGLGDRQAADGGSVPGRSAEAEPVVPLREDVAALTLAVGGERLDRQLDGDRFGFSRLEQGSLFKPFQFLRRHVQLGHGGGGIQLHHLFAGAAAGVGHFHREGEGFPVQRRAAAVQGEGGVGEAVAEGVARLFAEGIEIAVADVDAFGVGGLDWVFQEDAGGGIVFVPSSPGSGQLAGRGDPAGQDIGDGFPRLPGPPGPSAGSRRHRSRRGLRPRWGRRR